MSTIDKALGLLELFTLEEPQWTVEAAASRCGIPTSSAYRYFRSLTKAGLIVDFAAGRYVIGPAVFELDRVARQTDPLVVAAQQAMDDLVKKGPDRSVVILARIFRLRVMCIDQRRRGYHPLSVSFERGRPMPLYRGSVSKIILANLSPRLLVRCYQHDHKEIAESGLGETLKSFKKTLRELRKLGYCLSKSELDQGVIGISAPISSPENDVFASISIVSPDQSQSSDELDRLVSNVVRAGEKVTKALVELNGA